MLKAKLSRTEGGLQVGRVKFGQLIAGFDRITGLFVELGEQYMGDSAMDSFRGMLKDIGEADMEAAFAEALVQASS